MIAGLQTIRIPVRAGFQASCRSSVLTSSASKRRPKAKVTWAELIGRIASGDRQAFKTLFDHFAPRIKGFFLKKGCTADEAEEIAQETMIAVWRKATQFDPGTAGAAAWIFTIARNQRIDAARRTARAERLKEEVEREYEPAFTEPADLKMSRTEDAVRVAAAIDLLSAEQSLVIRLSFLEDRPHSEIAERLQIPLGTVKSRIRLAMNRLREILDEQA